VKENAKAFRNDCRQAKFAMVLLIFDVCCKMSKELLY